MNKRTIIEVLESIGTTRSIINLTEASQIRHLKSRRPDLIVLEEGIVPGLVYFTAALTPLGIDYLNHLRRLKNDLSELPEEILQPGRIYSPDEGVRVS